MYIKKILVLALSSHLWKYVNSVHMILYMSIGRLPNVPKYWSQSIGMVAVNNVMSQKRFEQLRVHIHTF